MEMREEVCFQRLFGRLLDWGLRRRTKAEQWWPTTGRSRKVPQQPIVWRSS